MHALTKARLAGGLKTIIDATNLHARDRRAFRDCATADTRIFYHVIDRPLEEKHRDAGWRDEVVINGVKLIDKHAQSFKSGIKHILAGDDDPRVTVYDHRK
jgi:predicted kinase